MVNDPLQDPVINPLIDLVGGFGVVSIPTPADYSEIKMWYSGDATGNTTTTIDEDFGTSDVDTGNDKITVTLPSGEFTRDNPYDAMTCRFTTTGTLPSPLAVDTDYIFEDNGDGTISLYPVLTDSDYATLNGYEDGESVPQFQAYACQAGKIDLTTTGSGTHTMTTEPILSLIEDRTGNGVDMTAPSLKQGFRLITDGNGKKYIERPGITARSDKNDDAYGKIMEDNIDNTTFGNLFDGKRYAFWVSIGKMRMDTHVSMNRLFITPDKVNAGNGFLDANSHGLSNGDPIQYGVLSDGGAFPTPTVAFAATIYARAYNTNRITLHPTATDAINNTNKYVFSDTGTGVFYVTDNTDVQTEAAQRAIHYDMNVTANGHDFSPAAISRVEELTISAFYSGSLNGRLNQVFNNTKVGRGWTYLKVKVFIPSGTVPPDCLDTGTALESGTYWMTAEGNSTTRLHRTEALAQAHYNTGVSSLTDEQVIKYDNHGSISGKIIVHMDDNFQFRQFNDSFTVADDFPLNQNKDLGVWVCIQDYDDVSGNSIYWAGYNSTNSILDDFESTDSSATLVATGNSNINAGNADEPHVPSNYDEYETVIGFSDTDPTSICNDMITYMQNKYNF